MYELIKLTEKCYYIDCPSKMGIVRISENEVCLIDSGNSRQTAKKVKRILDGQGFSLKAVYLTHSHADHIGGCRYLQSETGCRVFAPGIECDFTCHPLLEGAYVWGGFAPEELRERFFLAEECVAEPLTPEALPEGMEAVPLPGHSFDMVGYRVDGVFYIADSLSSAETLDKYGVGFIYDVKEYLNTLKWLTECGDWIFVPSHAASSSSVSALAEYNAGKVSEVAERIIGLAREPIAFEEILKGIFDGYSLTMNFGQYALVGSTVRSYLAYLKGEGRIRADFVDNRLLWKSI